MGTQTMNVLATVAVALFVGGMLAAMLDAQFSRPRDPDWLRELHSRYALQQKLEKNMGPESKEVLDRIMWDKYRDAP